MPKKKIFSPLYFLLFYTVFIGFTGCGDRADPRGPVEHVEAVFHPLDRIIFQIDFAERLIIISPENKDSWSQLAEQARTLLNDYVAGGDQDNIQAAIIEAEEDLDKIRIYHDFIV